MSIFNGQKDAAPAPAVKGNQNNSSLEKKPGEAMQKEPENKVTAAKEVVTPNYKDEIAVISPTTKIEGNISTEGNLVMSGQIVGNISSKGNLVLNGNSNGDISCESVVLDAGNVTSNINAAMNVIVKEGTSVSGNIVCKGVTVMGSVTGNIKADSVFLKKTAYVKGDVTAKSFMMEAGAKLKGKVEC